MSAHAIHLPAYTRPANLRPFDIRRDLLAVADLVELCFAPTLDSDGRSYIYQMRQAARAGRWLPQPHGDPALMGMVWVEDGILVGNLSLIPQTRGGSTRYLIANVAVHPNYRGRGIARQLTLAALEDVRKRGGQETWLQVDETNPVAIHLYSQIGFEQQMRRTSWRTWPLAHRPATQGVRIRERQGRDWRQQNAWLQASYPPDVRWQLPLSLRGLQPGLSGTLQRLFSQPHTLQWSAEQRRQLQGVLIWQNSTLEADRLWLAADARNPQPPVASLLAHASRYLEPDRKLALNYPAGQAVEALQTAGFTALRTLIWMRFPWEVLV